jgi:phosphoribosylanthranilate isomerase
MASHIIKICGIREPQMAEQAALAGADLIGVIFHPLSPRYVSLNKAIAISAALNKTQALPVAVFVNHTHTEMLHICKMTNIHIVQLHGITARAHHHLLPKEYQRIYVQNVSDNGRLQTDDGVKSLDSNRDFILVDHIQPGQGKIIDRSRLNYSLPFRWILAGGLSTSNVVDTIADVKPNGVDVSSGVESSKSHKDLFLIKQFIQSVRSHSHAS